MATIAIGMSNINVSVRLLAATTHFTAGEVVVVRFTRTEGKVKIIATDNSERKEEIDGAIVVEKIKQE